MTDPPLDVRRLKFTLIYDRQCARCDERADPATNAPKWMMSANRFHCARQSVVMPALGVTLASVGDPQSFLPRSAIRLNGVPQANDRFRASFWMVGGHRAELDTGVSEASLVKGVPFARWLATFERLTNLVALRTKGPLCGRGRGAIFQPTRSFAPSAPRRRPRRGEK